MRRRTLVRLRAAVAHVVLLAGGTGGAKLARGLLDELGPELVVIANTGDDVEIYGAHVSPDPDLVTFWLADAIDERGWGLAGDTFAAMDQLRALGEDDLVQPRRPRPGDRPAPRAAAGGGRAADAGDRRPAARVRRARAGARRRPTTRCAPTSAPRGRWRAFQEFMIRDRAEGPIEDVEYRGEREPRPTPEALEAMREARAIIIGPSNPVLSIDPILSVLSDDAPRRRRAGGRRLPARRAAQVLKGPTADCLRVGGPDAGLRRHRRPLRGPDRRLVADQRADARPDAGDRRRARRPRGRAAAWRARCSSSPPR